MDLQECFLRLAQIEEDGAELYQKFAEESSEKLKPVVILFSQEEEKHKELMLELSNNEKLKAEQLCEDVEKVIQKQVDYSNKNSKNLSLTSEKEFFKFSLQLEKNSIEIYTKLLGIFEKESFPFISFEALIGEERKHMLYILNKLYELK
jgi:rubrerythrin